MPVYPISFSIHPSKIIEYIPEKTKILSDIIPGKPYQFDNEEDYYNEYKQSIFAVTCRKSGWDCMRHYEIMANGCIPIFLNLEQCPETIMTHFPKDIILKSEKLYNSVKDLSLDKAKKRTRLVAEELIMYTHINLNTSSMAEYILKTSGHSNVSSILFLSGNVWSDYQRCLTLLGLKDILKSECHDYPKIEHLYKDNYINDDTLHGKGFSYGRILDQSVHNPLNDKTIIDDIRKHRYDIVIYGSFHRGIPFFDLVNSFYKPNEIILICGEDTHKCDYMNILAHNSNYHVFVRELDLQQ